MEDPVKRRIQIVAEIARLGERQKKTARVVMSTGRRSPKGEVRYDERARRIAELVLELSGIDKFPPTRNSESSQKHKRPER